MSAVMNFLMHCPRFLSGMAFGWSKFLIPAVLGVTVSLAQAAAVTFTSSGTWTAPSGVTSVTVEAWGGGGAGGGATGNPAKGGGGAGGQYSSKVVPVTPGSSYAVVVGSGGKGSTGNGAAGGDSSFAAGIVVAKGGAGGGRAIYDESGGAGGSGSAAGGVGTSVYAGGDGSDGFSSDTEGGAGGGGAGSTGAGGNADGDTAGAGTAAGGGSGGAGRTTGGNGNAGAAAGGGGGGGYAPGSTNRSGGAGAAGKVVITYFPAVVSINRASNNPAIANSEVSWTVAFNIPVTGVDASDFVLVPGGSTKGASITSVSGSGTSWTVTANTGTGIPGTLGLNLVDDNSIKESGTGLALGGAAVGDGNFTGAVYALQALIKRASASSALVGDVVTFTITLSNPNSTALSSVVVTDALPAGMAYSSHAAGTGAVNVSGQVVTWAIPSLPAGGSAQLLLAVSLTAKGKLTNTVTSPGFPAASAEILVMSGSYVHYRMDETAGSWKGTTGEVFDSGAKGLHGYRRMTGSSTSTNAVDPKPDTIPSPPVVGGFCNAGRFDGSAVVESASSTFFQFTKNLSASAWIYPTAYPSGSSDYSSILSNDTNYEFHLDPSGHLYWWWQASTLTSAATIPLNQWTHIAITFDSSAGKQLIYINGVQDSATNNWKGTLSPNKCPFYIGGDISTGSGCTLMSERNFQGMIDEAKIYDYTLSADEVDADMTLGRLCSGIFDHVRIEHDGTASTCTPKNVTLKACLNATCTALYPGTVTVQLSPSGWIPGNTVTISGGVTTATLSNASISAPSLTLGTVSVNPNSTGTTRCFNGATETCTLNVASTACSFDAVERTASPQTHLYTKLAGAPFNVDVLALSNSTTVNTGYTGTVTVDVVDTCPNGQVLSSAAPTITYGVADQGRKTVSFTSPSVAKSAQVRIKAGTSYACSYDKFAIRPSAVTLTTSNAGAAAPGPSAAPAVKAGSAFNIGATTIPAGYTEVLALDDTKLSAQAPGNGTTPQGGGTVGTLVLSPLLAANTAQKDNASYSEAGYLYANPGAFTDTVFTSVDKSNQVPNCAKTDTCDCLLSGNTTNPGVPDNLSDVPINGRYGCYVGNKASFAFGRFIPDHFDTAVPQQACAAGNFTYSGQPFPLTVTAKNRGGGTTQNYEGVFARIVTLVARKDDDTASNPGPGAFTGTSATVKDTAFEKGVAGATPIYAFTVPTTAPTTVRVRAQDGEVSSLATEGLALIRSGRARLNNAYGSELLDLPVEFRTEYWDGAGWLLNALDSCTGDTALGAANAVSLALATTLTGICVLDSGKPGLSGAGCASPVASRQYREGGVSGFAGNFNLWLSAPGAGQFGRVIITPTVPPWLGPVQAAIAGFGRYKSPLIYRRENF